MSGAAPAEPAPSASRTATAALARMIRRAAGSGSSRRPCGSKMRTLASRLRCRNAWSEVVDDAEAVAQRSAEVDRRRLLEVGGGAAHLADLEAGQQDLREHLVVEDEVVGVLEQRQRLEHLAREGAVAGVVLGELGPAQQVLERGEARGSRRTCRAACRPRSARPPRMREPSTTSKGPSAIMRDHRGDQLRRVLVVRVEHHDDVRARPRAPPVAGLLVAAVAAVAARGRGCAGRAAARSRPSRRGSRRR